MGAKKRVASKQLRILRPSKGTGQTGMTRKEDENCPVRMEGRGRVLGGEKGVVSTSITEIGDGSGPWEPSGKSRQTRWYLPGR